MVKKEEKRVKTGVPGLDKFIQGGLLLNSLTVLSGGVGVGKSTFGIQFIHSGLQGGEPGLIISTKDSVKDIKRFASSFSWNFDKWESEEMLKIVFYTPNELRTIIGGGAGTLLDLIDDISASRLFIDSLGFVSNSFDNFSELVSFSFTFLNTFKKIDITTVATVEHSSNSDKMEIWKYLADTSLEFMTNVDNKFKKSRFIEIIKMRNTTLSKDFLKYRISSKGMEVIEK